MFALPFVVISVAFSYSPALLRVVNLVTPPHSFRKIHQCIQSWRSYLPTIVHVRSSSSPSHIRWFENCPWLEFNHPDPSSWNTRRVLHYTDIRLVNSHNSTLVGFGSDQVTKMLAPFYHILIKWIIYALTAHLRLYTPTRALLSATRTDLGVTLWTCATPVSICYPLSTIEIKLPEGGA